jgi:alpha-beta hydrolase superfamily lysophospholipase
MYPTTRYLAEVLVDHNFCVYSGDFCGHGQSYGTRGYIESPDVLLEDANHIIEFARKSHPKLLLFLGGVSMGGAVAMMLSIELKTRISGMILMAPMVSVNVPRWQRLTLKNLHRVSKTMALRLPTSNHSDLNFRDVGRRKEAEDDPYAYKGPLRIATAVTCIDLSRRIHQELQKITTPFLALMALEDYFVDNNAIDDLMELAQSTDKTLKEYEALHGLLCEEEPLRSQIERDIVEWLMERTLPSC